MASLGCGGLAALSVLHGPHGRQLWGKAVQETQHRQGDDGPPLLMLM